MKQQINEIENKIDLARVPQPKFNNAGEQVFLQFKKSRKTIMSDEYFELKSSITCRTFSNYIRWSFCG